MQIVQKSVFKFQNHRITSLIKNLSLMSTEKLLENYSVLLEHCFILTDSQVFYFLFFFWKRQHVFHFFKKLTFSDPASKQPLENKIGQFPSFKRNKTA